MSAPWRPQSAAEAPLPGSKVEPSPVLEWVGLLLPAATFFVHLQVGYVLVPWACTTRQDVWVHVAGALSVVLSLLGNLAAWRTWMSRAVEYAPVRPARPADGDDPFWSRRPEDVDYR